MPKIKPHTFKCIGYFLLGLITCLGLPPWGFWPLSLVGFACFFGVLNNKNTKKGNFLYPFLYGLGYFTLGLYWIGNAILVDWQTYWWAYPFATLGLPIFFGVLWGLTGCVCLKYSPHSTIARLTTLLIGYAFIEWLRSWIFTGFPWNLIGYIWAETLPIAQITSLGGIYLLTLLTLFWASLLSLIYIKKSKKAFAVILILLLTSFLSVYGYGKARMNQPINNTDTAFLIVQPNIDQRTKWDNEYIIDHMHTLFTLSYYQGQETPFKTLNILWPETAMSSNYFEHPKIQDDLRRVLQSWPMDVNLLAGMLHLGNSGNDENGNQNIYNSIYHINKNAELVNRYDKSHLVPFGEYIPLLPDNWVQPLTGIQSFAKGIKGATLPLSDTQTLYPLICYESIFSAHLNTTNKKRDTNDAIIIVTNDAWYGDSAGPYQHNVMAKFRAIEQGMPVFRSANTGVSSAYDPYGREISSIPFGQKDSQIVRQSQSLNAPTGYVIRGNTLFFGGIGLLFILLLALKIKRV